MRRYPWSLALLLLIAAATSAADPEKYPTPSPNSADEPLAKAFSLENAGTFLDNAVSAWTRDQNCASCHTSYPYLMARPAIGNAKAPALLEMRSFFEKRIAKWDSGGLPEGSEGTTEIVASAATLAFHDAQSTGKLHLLTRKALDKMWTVQKEDGAWDWNKHELPPLEYDEYYGAVYAAMGVGFAPEGYAKGESAKAGLARLRKYFAANPPLWIHHKAWLLFASQRLDGLMSAEEQKKTIQELLALQREDGGWNLPSLGDWKRLDDTVNDPKGPSDGYATGLVIYILRQSGVPKDDKQIQRGVKWLKTNQRESGRWFTRSVSADRDHWITNAGTAFAVLAIKACE